jgi:hypothetical protein
VTVNGFQDRRIRPLCHLSGANIDLHSIPAKNSSRQNFSIGSRGIKRKLEIELFAYEKSS